MDKAKIWIGTLEELFQHDFEMKDHFGYVYAVELEHGVKIGRTENPHQRMAQLQNVFEKYGDRKMLRVAVSPIHSNYCHNETSLLSTFGYIRRGSTEMTDAPFDFVVGAMDILRYSSDYDYEKDEKALEELKKFAREMWGIQPEFITVVSDIFDGYNDIKITVTNKGAWTLIINKGNLESTKDNVLDFIVWYALHHDIGDIVEWYEEQKDDEYWAGEPDEPLSIHMLESMRPYTVNVIIDSLREYIHVKIEEYNKKFDRYIQVMREVATQKGYEYSLPPVATYEQIINEDYTGLEPIDPATLR